MLNAFKPVAGFRDGKSVLQPTFFKAVHSRSEGCNFIDVDDIAVQGYEAV